MGRGTSGALLAPVHDVGSGDATDHRLVARVRQGDDRAFEALYERYHRRIHAYVLGMVKDHGRAEDVTQEVFVSALRRMRATERPIAFKPWIYEIAKNACIDAFRRSKRAEEVSFDADDALGPADHSRLVGAGPTPDAAVAAKQDLESLCGAFGGLSETHHEILVLRELEGLSYAEIGRRMGMSRPAVESTLFRARRRLTEEYDDIVSGARCLRIQAIIQVAAQSRLGTRDTRRLARHLAHCQPCRREALESGLDRSLIARPTVRERVATRVAAFLPLPAFIKARRGADAAPPPGSGRAASLMSHLPALQDQLTGGWGRLAAGGALLVAGVGAGVGVHHMAATPHRPAASSHPAAVRAAHAAPVKTRSTAEALPATPTAVTKVTASSSSKKATRRSPARRSSAHRSSPAGSTAASSAPTAASDAAATATSTAGTVAKTRKRVVPAGPPDPVKTTTDAANSAAGDVGGTVAGTVKGAVGTVDNAAQGVTGGGPVGDTVHQAAGAVDGVADAAGNAVNQAGSTVTSAVGGITGG